MKRVFTLLSVFLVFLLVSCSSHTGKASLAFVLPSVSDRSSDEVSEEFNINFEYEKGSSFTLTGRPGETVRVDDIESGLWNISIFAEFNLSNGIMRFTGYTSVYVKADAENSCTIDVTAEMVPYNPEDPENEDKAVTPEISGEKVELLTYEANKDGIEVKLECSAKSPDGGTLIFLFGTGADDPDLVELQAALKEASSSENFDAVLADIGDYIGTYNADTGLYSSVGTIHVEQSTAAVCVVYNINKEKEIKISEPAVKTYMITIKAAPVDSEYEFSSFTASVLSNGDVIYGTDLKNYIYIKEVWSLKAGTVASADGNLEQTKTREGYVSSFGGYSVSYPEKAAGCVPVTVNRGETTSPDGVQIVTVPVKFEYKGPSEVITQTVVPEVDEAGGNTVQMEVSAASLAGSSGLPGCIYNSSASEGISTGGTPSDFVLDRQLKYKWYKNQEDVSDALGSCYSANGIQIGDVFTVKVSCPSDWCSNSDRLFECAVFTVGEAPSNDGKTVSGDITNCFNEQNVNLLMNGDCTISNQVTVSWQTVKLGVAPGYSAGSISLSFTNQGNMQVQTETSLSGNEKTVLKICGVENATSPLISIDNGSELTIGPNVVITGHNIAESRNESGSIRVNSNSVLNITGLSFEGNKNTISEGKTGGDIHFINGEIDINGEFNGSVYWDDTDSDVRKIVIGNDFKAKSGSDIALTVIVEAVDKAKNETIIQTSDGSPLTADQIKLIKIVDFATDKVLKLSADGTISQ